jgi:hypothetical protein
MALVKSQGNAAPNRALATRCAGWDGRPETWAGGPCPGAAMCDPPYHKREDGWRSPNGPLTLVSSVP